MKSGSKIALVRSYLRVPQAAEQAKVLIFLVKKNQHSPKIYVATVPNGAGGMVQCVPVQQYFITYSVFICLKTLFFTKQCRHRSDCSTWGSLIWVHSFCFTISGKCVMVCNHHSCFDLSSCILNACSPPRKNETFFLHFHF